MKNKLDAAGFEKEYPNIVEAAKLVEQQIKEQDCHVVVAAKVKSGKRILKECLAVRNEVDKHKNKDIVHFYITKLDRRDITVQLDEMRDNYGIKVFKIQTKTSVEPLTSEARRTLNDGKCMWVHFDESDYGTAEFQLVSDFFKEFVEENDVRFIFYSATNEEVNFSDFTKYYPVSCIAMKPGPDYKGALWYLENNLAKQATSFWNFDTNELTTQGKEAIEQLVNGDKLFGIVRFPSADQYGKISQKHHKAHKAFLSVIEDQYGVKIRFIDGKQDNMFRWGKEDEASWYGYVNNGKKVLLVLCQTCTRSTEVGFHKHICFWHDYRNGGKTPYNTRVQAYLRVAHYNPDGCKIMLYVDLPTLKLEAGKITYEEYFKQTGIPLSTRVISKILRKHQYAREFYAEGDPDIAIDNAKNNPTVKFLDGRKTVEPYIAGKDVWESDSYSRIGSKGGLDLRDPVPMVMNGKPRSNKKPFICFDAPCERLPESWEKLIAWAEQHKTTTNDGRLLCDVLRAGKTVFYYAAPTDLDGDEVDIHSKNTGKGKTMYKGRDEMISTKEALVNTTGL